MIVEENLFIQPIIIFPKVRQANFEKCRVPKMEKPKKIFIFTILLEEKKMVIDFVIQKCLQFHPKKCGLQQISRAELNHTLNKTFILSLQNDE